MQVPPTAAKRFRPGRRAGAAFAAACCLASWALAQDAALVPMRESALTHGPMTGDLTATSVRVWARTRRPLPFNVRFGTDPELRGSAAAAGRTTLERDNTGRVTLTGLRPNTKYYYAVEVEGRRVDTRVAGRANSFTTLPDGRTYHSAAHNPRGLFNFRFEHGSCASQNPNAQPSNPPTYATMLRELKDRIHFRIMNGDWLYEELRDTTAEQWAAANGVTQVPPILRLANGISGVWENYKLYLSRSQNLANLHREIPFYITFDDHEILNDVYGCGEVGLRTDSRRPEAQGDPNRRTHEGMVERAVFRDPALQAWEDYLGWANPDIGAKQPIRFGSARLEAGSSVLTDAGADFGALDLDRSATLHVQWGQGNSGVYEIARVLDRNRLEIRPPAAVTEEARYSIGTQHYSRFRVSNCEFFLLDSRTFRTLHGRGRKAPGPPTMLGARQLRWLAEGMKSSDADFFFVVSSVPFTVPHVGSDGLIDGKDDAWTAFPRERESVIRLFESLRRPVFVLTGDLHASYAVEIGPGIWEFTSGPHNSTNHRGVDAGSVPAAGWFDSAGRRVRMKWSTHYLGDVPRSRLLFPNYCVIQLNNIYLSPDRAGGPRWVAFPEPQVVFQYYDGLTGELKFAESVSRMDASRRR